MDKIENPGRFKCAYCGKDNTRTAIDWFSQWLSLSKAAELLNCSHPAVRYLAQRDFRVIRLGNQYLVPPFVVWDWIRKRKARGVRAGNGRKSMVARDMRVFNHRGT